MFSAEKFQNLPNVSRETFSDFQAWEHLLRKWNARINLVSENALEDFWGRHALDSWQLWDHVPDNTESLLDLGSGAGFPGLALAIGCKGRGRGKVTLVESAGKKANFLQTIIRELDLPAKVWAGRAEKLPPTVYDVISARAFAPLPRLYTYAHPFWGTDTLGLFLKGENVQAELTDAQKTWISETATVPSQTETGGVILKIKGLTPKPT